MTQSEIELADISHWNVVKDWIKLSSKVDGLFIRGGSINKDTGECYTDYRLGANATGARAFDIPFGFYWYFRPKYSGRMQADYFYGHCHDYAPTLPYVIDCEVSGVISTVARTETLAFINRLRELTGRYPIIYTRATYWNYYIQSIYAASLCDLWVARYHPTIEHPWADNPALYKPSNWTKWHFWQWSADGNHLGEEYGVESDSIDLNRWSGTRQEWEAYAGLTPPPVQQVVKVKITAPAGVKVEVEVEEIP